VNPERLYKKKAKENYDVAKSCKATHPNVSASRLYYALFQGSVGEFEKEHVQPQQIDRGAADAMEQRGQKWTHSFVKNNGGLIGLSPRQCDIIRQAWMLRVVADYSLKEVNASQLDELIERAADILECLGVIG